MEAAIITTSLGRFKLVQNDGAMVSLLATTEPETTKALSQFMRQAVEELQAYCAGTLQVFTFPYHLTTSHFTRTILDYLTMIPYGTTLSYQAIAKQMGNANAQRAVGGACNRNPLLLRIPCHRVIGKSGKLTGFREGLAFKEKLLAHERT